jgi:uncharacterized protein YgiM (DUF1202 family)
MKQFGRSGWVLSRHLLRWGSLFGVLLVAGCSSLRPKPPVQWVYVSAKQTFLRDRVAAVSNRTATVANGDKLQVLDHGRRFIKVQTAKGEQGWIDEKAVANEQVYGMFEALREEHKNDPVAASAVVRDEVYLHARPGVDAEKFYLMEEGAKLKMLQRATLPKPVPGAKPVKAAAPATSVVTTAPAAPLAATAKVAANAKAGTASVAQPPAPPVMQDWWLVRDAEGRTGWILSNRLDVDAPAELAKYAEGQRIVGAYVLTTVNDPDASSDDKSVPADKNIPIYVTVLSPYKAGLPYDFDQVRVFTWSLKKHRYETGFRDKNIEGYLPVTIKVEKDPNGKSVAAQTPAPTFSYRVLAAESPDAVPDPVTGAVVPGKTVVKTYRLEGNLVRRILQPGMPAPMEAHPAPPEKKAVVAKKKR